MDRRQQLLAGAHAARARAERTVLWRALSALHLHAVRARMARMAMNRWSSAMVARWGDEGMGLWLSCIMLYLVVLRFRWASSTLASSSSHFLGVLWWIVVGGCWSPCICTVG